MDTLWANWSSKELAVFLLFCSGSGLLSAVCAAYSYRVDEANHLTALNSRIRGTISLIVVVALMVAAASVYAHGGA